MTLPLLIYDGDCGFCKKWIAYWKQLTRESVDYAASQEVGEEMRRRYPQLSAKDFEQSVILVLPDGTIRYGAGAVFESLAQAPHLKWAGLILRLYRKFSIVRSLSEKAYRLVARRRMVFSYLTYFFWGEEVRRPSYQITSWIYLRALALIYFAAFLSLKVQLPGLVGSRGMIPSDYSDFWIQFSAWVGLLFSGLLFIGLAPAICIGILWVSYFFLTQVCGEFLWFQWDGLLSEMGFLSLFLAPWTLGLDWFWLSPHKAQRCEPSGWALWVLRWLLFRVIFFSGWVKLASGDLAWRELSALSFHFETQPLPTPAAWWMQQLPNEVLQGLTGLLLFVELVIPWLIFLPRRVRFFAFPVLILLQIFINLTGNYGFFGLQVSALCLLLLDDRLIGSYWRFFWGLTSQPERALFLAGLREPRWRSFLDGIVIGGIVLIGICGFPSFSGWVREGRIYNSYGVFAVMTTHRDELVLEGSPDGVRWEPYEFRWKPGDPHRRLRWLGPHMPRLDWQMWFAALDRFESQAWLQRFMLAVLKGEEPVTRLLGHNPFPASPPLSLRFSRYRYRFSSIDERAATGQWWIREWLGFESPPVTLEGP